MNRFTPGPWKKVAGTLVGSDGNEVVAAGLGIGLGQDNGDGNRLANTSLITAAPELLESLGVMTALCRIKYGNKDDDVWREIKKALSVLDKARGKS